MRSLFVTQVYESSFAGDAGFEAFNLELQEACQMLADEDVAGQAWCKEHHYGGYTSYASLNDLPQRATIFAQLKTRIDRHARKYAQALEFDLGAGRLRMDSLWVNVLKPGAAHTSHIHPHSVISGTVYVATPPGASALKLEDPRLAMMMAAPPRLPDAAEQAKAFVYLQPQPGTLLMWESWLRHEVTANAARRERISVSFNYGWR